MADQVNLQLPIHGLDLAGPVATVRKDKTIESPSALINGIDIRSLRYSFIRVLDRNFLNFAFP